MSSHHQPQTGRPWKWHDCPSSDVGWTCRHPDQNVRASHQGIMTETSAIKAHLTPQRLWTLKGPCWNENVLSKNEGSGSSEHRFQNGWWAKIEKWILLHLFQVAQKCLHQRERKARSIPSGNNMFNKLWWIISHWWFMTLLARKEAHCVSLHILTKRTYAKATPLPTLPWIPLLLVCSFTYCVRSTVLVRRNTHKNVQTCNDACHPSSCTSVSFSTGQLRVLFVHVLGRNTALLISVCRQCVVGIALNRVATVGSAPFFSTKGTSKRIGRRTPNSVFSGISNHYPIWESNPH